MFGTRVVEKFKITLCQVTLTPNPRKSCHYLYYVGKYRRAGQATMTIWRMRIACWIPKATDTH